MLDTDSCLPCNDIHCFRSWSTSNLWWMVVGMTWTWDAPTHPASLLRGRYQKLFPPGTVAEAWNWLLLQTTEVREAFSLTCTPAASSHHVMLIHRGKFVRHPATVSSQTVQLTLSSLVRVTSYAMSRSVCFSSVFFYKLNSDLRLSSRWILRLCPSQSYFTTGGLAPISSSWRQASRDSRPVILFSNWNLWL
jgi:hypothetical protein